MSYNIFNKNASFQGTGKGETGSLEYMVDTHSDQTADGSKTFTNLTASNGMDFGSGLISGSGKISASFFYGDGAGLSGVATAAGVDREVQFNDGGSDLGASSTFIFTAANQLQVTGQISASLGVSGSSFYGDGSNLTAVTASFVTASNVNGLLDASQVNIGQGLEDAAGAIQVELQSNSGIGRNANGIALDVFGLTTGVYNDASTIALGVTSGDTKKITLSALENSLQIGGGNVTGSNSILNSVLPTTISQPIISGSTAISGAFFFGDGAGLTNVSATATPAGSNTQIQFNADGVMAADADLTFLTGSNTLATTNVSASADVQVGEHITGSGDIVLLGAGNSILFDTASGTGTGPEITTAASNEMTIDGDNTVKIQADSFVVIRENTTPKVTFNFADDFINVQMPLSSSQYVSASIVDSLTGYKLGDQTVIDSDGNFAGNNAWFNEITASSVISSSADISASVFHGDGSQLTGIGGSSTTEYHVATNSIIAQAQKKFLPLSPSAGGSTMNSRANFTTIFHNNKNFLQWIAPASGSIKNITVNLTDVSTLYSIPLTTGGNTVTSKDDIIFILFKNNNDTTITSNFVGHLTASATTLSISSSVGRKFSIPCNTGLFSGSSTFDSGDLLKMATYLPNANGGTSADAEIVLTYEVSASSV